MYANFLNKYEFTYLQEFKERIKFERFRGTFTVAYGKFE